MDTSARPASPRPVRAPAGPLGRACRATPRRLLPLLLAGACLHLAACRDAPKDASDDVAAAAPLAGAFDRPTETRPNETAPAYPTTSSGDRPDGLELATVPEGSTREQALPALPELPGAFDLYAVLEELARGHPTTLADASPDALDLASAFEEPALGAALDGPAASAAPVDERHRLPGHDAWLGSSAPAPNAVRLLARIADAGAHGLDPARYDLDGLQANLAALFERPLSPATDLASRAALIYRFNRAFERLATDLGRGLVDGRPLQRRLFRERLAPDVRALRAALLRGDLGVEEALDRVAPTHERYLRLVDTMRKLLAEHAAGNSARTRVETTETLRAGARGEEVVRLKRRLIETDDLTAGTDPTPMFDAPLVLAVEAFQRRHGIAPNGVVGPRTRAALNRTLEDDLDDLAMSLERWRWMPRELGERHVFVNLPDFRLQLDNGAQRVIDMAVVIGDVEHPTPSFSEAMSYLEFSPTWTVPASIANRELVPRERRQPGYLKSRNFDFLEFVDGKLQKVPHETVEREDFAQRPFPYVLRQRGGSGNALGRMKFMMPNPWAIYLHDTQAKSLFSHHARAYSHGCVRVSDPDRLASLLLQIDGRSHAETRALIASRETRRASLRRPVPTHLAYLTTWVDRAGDLQRRADVYGNDPALREALSAIGVLPSARLEGVPRSG